MVAPVVFLVYRLPSRQLQHQYEQHDSAADDSRPDGSVSNDNVASASSNGGPLVNQLAQLPLTGTVLYNGETFDAQIVLANQSATPLANVALKVELTTERGGGAAVLADNSSAPLPALPPGAQHVARISHDVRELGAQTLACSAVFSTPDGERKYHVQFFKWTSLNPLYVKTKLRALPLGSCAHGAMPMTHAVSTAPATQHIGTDASDSSSSSSSSAHNGALLLEVGIENSMQVPLLLPAVRFLTLPGVIAQQITAESSLPATADMGDGATDSTIAPATDMAGPKISAPGVGPSSKQEQERAGSLADDTRPQSDLTQPGVSTSSISVAGHSRSQHALGPSGGARHFLWRIHLAGQALDSARSVSAAAALGRLEVHWRSMDGHSGRLQTQPILGLPLATVGRDVRLALHGLPEVAMLEVPFEVQLRVMRRPRTADAQQHQQQHQQQPRQHEQQSDSLGPLHIIHMDTTDVAAGAAHECGVMVHGSRSLSIGEVPPGGSAAVGITLSALRGGVQRVPAFVVVSGDGRPLDTVHDLHLLVTAS